MHNRKIIIKGEDRTADILKCEMQRGVYWITFKNHKR